jgi:AcrR family transcriptional regulator
MLTATGLAGLNVRDLGAAVGASSTVVYTLFGGREQMLMAVLEDALEQLANTAGGRRRGPARVPGRWRRAAAPARGRAPPA